MSERISRTVKGFVATLAIIGVVASVIGTPDRALAARFPNGTPRTSLRSISMYGSHGRTIQLRDGRTLVISAQGFGTLYDVKHHAVLRHWIPISIVPHTKPGSPEYDQELRALSFQLDRLQHQLFAPGRVLVVFKSGVTAPLDDMRVAPETLKTLRRVTNAQTRHAQAPRYTTDFSLNAVLVDIGTTRVHRLFATMDRGSLSTMRNIAQSRIRKPLLDISNAFSIEMSAASVEKSVQALRKMPSVAYVSEDFVVSPLETNPRQFDQAALRRSVGNIASTIARRRTQGSGSSTVIADSPPNTSVAASFQELLDASGINAIAPYAEIKRQFQQLPGTGEIVTNVSIGDMFAAEDVTGIRSPQNPCPSDAAFIGPTMHLIGNQRFMDWPGLPLIPAYAADANGRTDPHYVSCEQAVLDEVGLDFTMMSGLPTDQQRSNERTPAGTVTDILGVAPGAAYRLFVPASNAPDGGGGNFLSDIDGVFLAASNLAPQTNVITASLGIGNDVVGFPGRFLEDDPLSAAVIASIVNAKNIVVCISAGDGTRTFTQAAIGPSGGSAATNVTTDQTATTNLNDLQFSTAPSVDLDSGSIDVGAVTLNDIFARDPFDPQNAAFVSQLAYPTTRYDGEENLSSGFGTRVNISAPGDNVVAFDHVFGGAFDTTDILNEAGTSASAPETAAAAAVVLQVARLTNHPFANPQAVRSFLVQTATPLVQPSQTDQPLTVGPELNLGKAVEQLFAQAGIAIRPQVERVAIAQRHEIQTLFTHGSAYFTATDPGSIDLIGDPDAFGNPDGSGLHDWITIAPDWQGMPNGTTYALSVAGNTNAILATTPFARLQPATILTAARQPIASATPRTVRLTYAALQGHHSVARTTFELTFGPSPGTSQNAPAPFVPPVVSGSSVTITYDLSSATNLPNPVLVITEPGRFNIESFPIVHALVSQPLTSTKGTLTIPTSALQGTGIYGVSITSSAIADPLSGFPVTTPFSYFRLQDVPTARPPAPLLLAQGDIGIPGHNLVLPYKSNVNVSWNVSNVANATGAILEVSAPGPTLSFLFSTFNNPNGSIFDNNGIDTGSVKTIPLSGVSGTATFNTNTDLGLRDGMLHQVRILPMAGGTVVGEASDISTLEELGQESSTGGFIEVNGGSVGGFGINPNGNDGTIVSTIPLSNGTFENTVDFFDQSTNAVSVSDFFTNDSALWTLAGGGYFGAGTTSNAALVNAVTSDHSTFIEVNPLTLNNDVFDVPFSLPSVTSQIIQVSNNAADATGAALWEDTSSFSPIVQLSSLDLVNGAFAGTPITTTLCALGCSFLFNTDMSLHKALIIHDTGFGTPVVYDTIDLATGATQTTPASFAGSQFGALGQSLAIDETTHKAMYPLPLSMSVGIFDLVAQTESQVAIPLSPQQLAVAQATNDTGAISPQFIAADPVNHLFLAFAPGSGQLFNFDINAQAALYVFDETGNLQKTITGFSIPVPTFLGNHSNYLQVNGAVRKAYVSLGTQLEIINY